MKTLSISTGWEEGLTLFKRERGLLIPVAMTLIGLPTLINQLVQPAVEAGQTPPPGPWVLVSFAMTLVTLWGSLVLYALCIGGGKTVGDAIREATGRFPVVLGATLLLVLGGIVLSLPMVAAASTGSRAVVTFALLPVFAIALWCAIRLLWLPLVILTARLGVVASIRHSWTLTRGHFPRLLGFMAMFILVFLVVAMASAAVGGILGTVLGAAAGIAGLGELFANVLAALLTSIVSALLAAVTTRLYRQAAG